MSPETLKSHVRTIADWPKPGVNFRDVTPLFLNPACLQAAVDWTADRAREAGAELVAGVDARGFVLAGAVAYKLGLPLVLVRKKGKLPHDTIEESYALEYGEAAVEIHSDAVDGQKRLLIVDDLIATGGTLEAAVRLFRRLGVERIALAALIDLPDLGGSRRLRECGCAPQTLIAFAESERDRNGMTGRS